MDGSSGMPVLGVPLHGHAGSSDPAGDTIDRLGHAKQQPYAMITHCIKDPFYFNMPFSFQNFSAPG